MGRNDEEDALPKSGGVLVLGPAVGGAGHIETLAAERGLALGFSDGYAISNGMQDMVLAQMRIKQGAEVTIRDLDGYATVRMVSNGLEMRAYGVGERTEKKRDREDFDDWGDDNPRGL